VHQDLFGQKQPVHLEQRRVAPDRHDVVLHHLEPRLDGACHLQTRRHQMASEHRILVTFGSKRGGTAEIAESIAAALRGRGLVTDCLPVTAVEDLRPYDTVIIGSALYAGGWVRPARRFVAHNAAELRRRAVWMFSSGPLDASANHAELVAPTRVAALIDRVEARDHTTFGGRLAPEAKGFAASAMAKTRAGDWRDWTRVHAWADQIADTVSATPAGVAAPVVTPARWLLATLCLSVGITAIIGGLALIARPDGSLIHMPTSVLDHSPFSSFFVPGLLLVLVVGLDNLIAGILVMRESTIANAAALVAGAALFIWIVAEMMFLRRIHTLQLSYLVAAIAIIAESMRRTRVSSLPPRMHALGA
jgi:menaquinone-dependent protoporphyrinogen oxidase